MGTRSTTRLLRTHSNRWRRTRFTARVLGKPITHIIQTQSSSRTIHTRRIASILRWRSNVPNTRKLWLDHQHPRRGTSRRQRLRTGISHGLTPIGTIWPTGCYHIPTPLLQIHRMHTKARKQSYHSVTTARLSVMPQAKFPVVLPRSNHETKLGRIHTTV